MGHPAFWRLVAFLTETVYGLGANALDATAMKHIYEAKGRLSDKSDDCPCGEHRDAPNSAASGVTDEQKSLMSKPWPDRLPQLRKNSGVPDVTTEL